MESSKEAGKISFGTRLALGLKLMFSSEFAQKVNKALESLDSAPVEMPPEKQHASGLFLLGALQREGRLVDFLQQDVAAFSDEQVGAAARVVHGGSRKVLQQYFKLEPVATQAEGSEVTMPKGFDSLRWRPTGNVAGDPPFRGVLRHHGWVASQVRMPVVSEKLDYRVIAPAEVELA